MTREDLEVELEPGAAGRIGAGNRERSGHVFRHLGSRVAKLALVVGLVLAPLLAALAAEPIVIVLSWDGTRHDYPERISLPGLERMERTGLRAGRLIPVFPSNTFPGHVSLATGAHPERHGIVGNHFRDLQRGEFRRSSDASWIQAEPLWVAAERQGVRAAVFFWVGSESDWNGVGASDRRTPFDSNIGEPEKVDQILAWLDRPTAERPRLVMSWWHGADHVGHREGPDHRRVAKQLAKQDRELLRLMAGLDERELWKETTLIVTSDHGMAKADRFIDVVGPLKKSGIGVEIFSGGGMANLWLDNPGRRPQALKVLEKIEHVRAYASERLPEELHAYHPARSGQIVVLTEPPYHLFRPRGLAKARGLLGTHGYRPEHPDMGAIFYALGRGIAPATHRGEVRAIDLAATVAELLQIEPPRHSQGRSILSSAGGPSE